MSSAGGFFTTEPPGKPLQVFLNSNYSNEWLPGGSAAKNPPAVQEMWV